VSRPVVGIVGGLKKDPWTTEDRRVVYVGEPYVRCLQSAGATAVVLPPGTGPKEVEPWLDGLLLMGGPDIDPARYGQARHEATEEEDTDRFETESVLVRSLPVGTPILGVCYGCQFLNVLDGGDLEQHVPDRVGDDRHAEGRVETVRLEPDSRLASIMGESFEVKSYHHQAIGRLAAAYKAVGWAEDGTVEAIEHTSAPWRMAVQWHPERTADSQPSRRLFAAFVAAASAWQEERTSCGTW
jgi:putative glutamine amidotransferase